MRSPRSLLFAVALLVSVVGLGAICAPPKTIISVTPTDGDVVTSFSFSVEVELAEIANPATLEVRLNGALLTMSGGPTLFTASVDPGPPLRDQNLLMVRVEKDAGGTVTRGDDFQYLPPKARAFRVTDQDDCPTGPLAHCRIDDWMLANDAARFVIQDAPQREFSQIGVFGGNLIDAELVVGGVPQGRDNFFELQPSTNIESVVNATSVEIVNDGQDGTAAIVRTCGPDDLIDGINPSSVIADVGGVLPPGMDDQDFEIEGCTEYSLLPEKRWIEITTTVENLEDPDTSTAPDPLPLYVGDYINAAGEVEQWTPISAQAFVSPAQAGVGEMFANWGIEALTYYGFDETQGVDYALITPPGLIPTVHPSSTFTQTGVSYVLHHNSIPLVLGFGEVSSFEVPLGGSESYTRWFSVGDGSGSNAVAERFEILGLPNGTLTGCITEGAGGPAVPGSRVAAARNTSGGAAATLANVLRGHWVTGADGCYEGKLAPGNYLVAAGQEGFCYEAGCGSSLPTNHLVSITSGGTTVLNIALPAAGTLEVDVDEGGSGIPARVGVVGFDPSPERLLLATTLASNDTRTNFLFDNLRDPIPTGLSRTEYTDGTGALSMRLEPGSYQVAVSRGSEYSLFTQMVTITGGATTSVSASLVKVLDTDGYISSDYHTHMVASPDSRISQHNRVQSHAGEGVENIVATDHSVVTDLNPKIAAMGYGSFVHSTPGEEITTANTGHYNAYPQGQNLALPQTKGGTDWAGAAAPGEDFPSKGSFILSPAEIENAILTDPDNAGLETVVQINHISDHFFPMQIDTAQTPPVSNMPAPPCDPINPLGLSADCYRLDPDVPDFFHHYGALELWNGSTIGHQNEFLVERIGIWMNLLNQGLPTTFIADTDTHSYHDLRQGGARTWTPSSTDLPSGILDAEIGQAVAAGKAVGGQGLYLQARLEEDAQVADFSLAGSTSLTTSDGSVDLVIDIQAPAWAPYDSIEIYANASTSPTGTNGVTDVWYCSNPTQVLTAGVDFSVSSVPVGSSSRLETSLTVPLAVGTTDTWVMVLARGTQGVSPPMFPVHPSGISLAANPNLAALMSVTAGEAGIRSLAATNALYVDADGSPGFDPPGVSVLTSSPNCSE